MKRVTKFGIILGSSIWLVVVVVMPLYQFFTPFPRGNYENLLSRLKKWGYSFQEPNIKMVGKVAVLIHDVDGNLHGVETFLEVESAFNVRSSFYLRPDAEYFSQNIERFQWLERDGGWKIGFHYASLSRMNGNVSSALTLFVAQLEYMRSFFDVRSSHAHGDDYNLKINNEKLVNSTLWQEWQLTDISMIANASMISDSGHVWREPNTLKDIVVVNLHSDHW